MVQSLLDMCINEILALMFCNVGYQALTYFYGHILNIKV